MTTFPDGFVEVSRDVFFAAVFKDASLDPMPSRVTRNVWETMRGVCKVWGWTSSDASGLCKQYALIKGFP